MGLAVRTWEIFGGVGRYHRKLSKALASVADPVARSCWLEASSQSSGRVPPTIAEILPSVVAAVSVVVVDQSRPHLCIWHMEGRLRSICPGGRAFEGAHLLDVPRMGFDKLEVGRSAEWIKVGPGPVADVEFETLLPLLGRMRNAADS